METSTGGDLGDEHNTSNHQVYNNNNQESVTYVSRSPSTLLSAADNHHSFTELSQQQPIPNQSSPHHLMMMIDARICRDFLRGTCKRGPACKFIHQLIATPTSSLTGPHGVVNSNSTGNSSNTTLCRDFQNGVCSRGPTCRYAHIAPTLQTSSNPRLINDDLANDFDKEALMMIMMATHSSNTPMVITGSCFSQPQSPSLLSRETGSPPAAASEAEVVSHYLAAARKAADSSAMILSPTMGPPPSSLSPMGGNLSHGSSQSPGVVGGGVTSAEKIPLCRDYMKGRCDRGFRCRFRHITMADYGVKDKMLQQQKYAPFKVSLDNLDTISGRSFTTLTGPNYPHILENYDYLTGSFPHHQYHHPHHIHPSALPVVVSAASGATAAAIAGPLIISRQPPAAALQYSLPISMQSCPLTYVPASATINIVDPILEPPLTKRRLYQQQPQLLQQPLTCVEGNPNSYHDVTSNNSFASSSNSNYVAVASAASFDYIENHSSANYGGIGAHNGNRSNGFLSHSEKALVEENESLKQRLDTLKKQIAELNATVDMLLEQNRRLRLCGMGGGIVNLPHPPPPLQPQHCGQGPLVSQGSGNVTSMSHNQIPQPLTPCLPTMAQVQQHNPYTNHNPNFPTVLNPNLTMAQNPTQLSSATSTNSYNITCNNAVPFNQGLLGSINYPNSTSNASVILGNEGNNQFQQILCDNQTPSQQLITSNGHVTSLQEITKSPLSLSRSYVDVEAPPTSDNCKYLALAAKNELIPKSNVADIHQSCVQEKE